MRSLVSGSAQQVSVDRFARLCQSEGWLGGWLHAGPRDNLGCHDSGATKVVTRSSMQPTSQPAFRLAETREPVDRDLLSTAAHQGTHFRLQPFLCLGTLAS